MNGLVGKGSSAIMTVSTSQSHTQKAMLRERRRRRKKRREYQKGSLVHVLRAHPQLHQSAPGLCVWATKWSVCGQETAATTSRSPVFTVLLLAFWWQKSGAGPFHHQGNGPQVGPKVGPGDSWLPSHHWVHNMCQIFEDFQYTWMEHSQQHLSEMAAPGECPVELKT